MRRIQHLVEPPPFDQLPAEHCDGSIERQIVALPDRGPIDRLSRRSIPPNGCHKNALVLPNGKVAPQIVGVCRQGADDAVEMAQQPPLPRPSNP